MLVPAPFAAVASWYTSVTNKISDGLSTPSDWEIST